MRYYYWSVLLFLLAGMGCFHIPNQFNGLAPGYWRAELDIRPVAMKAGEANTGNQPVDFEEATEGLLPFVFEVIYENENDFYIEIINGEERIRVDDIKIGLDRQVGKDTFLINFPVFDSYITGLFESRVMEGEWVVNNRKNYRIPFVAKFGKNHRFTQLRKEPALDLTGKWEVQFVNTRDETDSWPAIGEFQQNGNELTGTFITETGDYRFLEGTVQDDKVYLSVFDGAHAFLFEAKILEDESLIGVFRSGNHYEASWTAIRNPDFKLRDPNQLTYLKEGYNSLDFAFENAAGDLISLKDPQYQGKPKIVQIFGTWCPNCREETAFLLDFKKENPNLDVEIIALAFERYRDKDQVWETINRFKNKMGIPYEILWAGYYDKKEAAAALPMLNHILSFPTMIFLNKKDEVVKIHTGFNGKATSEFANFENDFRQTITKLTTSDLEQ